MSIDSATFRSVLSHWSSGVTVVTCRGAAGVRGMTASSFTSVSLEPPLVLVCVKRTAHMHALLEETDAFAVHILAEGMEELSDRCAGFKGEDAHWLDDLPLRNGETGAPILDGALAWLECAVWQRHPAGDHTLFIGEVRAAGSGEGAPLLWYHRGYRALAGS